MTVIILFAQTYTDDVVQVIKSTRFEPELNKMRGLDAFDVTIKVHGVFKKNTICYKHSKILD